MLINRTITLALDAYKNSHLFMLRKDVTESVSYIEARSGWTDEIVFFGLQAYIREYLDQRVTIADIDKAERYAKSAMIPFNRDVWLRVVHEFDGFIPVRIEALAEGTIVPHGVPVVQISSDVMPEITAEIETSLLRGIWYTSNVATLSREIKKNIAAWYNETSDLDINEPMTLACALNDFGARSVSSGESAGLGAMSHAVSFLGSDSLEAIDTAVVYYDHDLDTDGPVVVSVPASEHSITTMNGEDGESAFVGRMIETFTELGFPIISIVGDSYDLDRFVTEYIGTDHKEKILARDGWIVVRPDSGIPHEIVPHVLKLLDEKFGSTVNSKGFKVLNPKVRVIQGDGVDRFSINDILEAVTDAGFSAENVCYGMGSKLLQSVGRDDHGWAMKTNQVSINGVDIDVQKRPKTDMSKASKAGKQAVVFNGTKLVSIRSADLANASHGTRNYLEPVWDTGVQLRKSIKFKQVRENAKI